MEIIFQSNPSKAEEKEPEAPDTEATTAGGYNRWGTYLMFVQGVFFHWASPKKLKYAKPWLGESTLTVDRPR